MEESRYIGDLIKSVQSINEFTTERLDDEQSIRDTLLDQTKYLGSQLELKKSIKRSADSIYSIQSDILYQENQVLGTREGYIKIQKNIDKIDKQINSLERDKDFLSKNESRISKDLVNSINQQISEAKRIRSQLKDQAEVSSKTRKNLGTSTFQLFSEILSNVGGKASQISKPFEAAAEASRSAVEPLIARNQAISKFKSARSELSSIADGSVKATDSLSKKLGLLGKNGEVLTGDAAKEAAENALEVGAKMGGPISQASMHAKGLSAGFKSIGLALAAAAGPIGMFMALFKLIRMVVEQMFEASQMTAEFSRNLLISRDQARKLYMDSFKIMDKYNQTEAIEGRNMILREDMFKAHEAINSSLGLQMNFMTGFDEAMSMDVAEVGKLMKYFDLSAENAGRVFIDAQVSGQSVKEFSENLYGELAMMGARTGVMMDFNKLINEAANVSGRLRHEMGGTVDNIAKSIYNTRLAGLNLEAASGSHAKLLDVYQSIESERQLEQMTGVDINGNRLREIAMYGSQKQLLSAIMSEANKLGGFLNLTRTQQEAFSKMVGISSNDIIDMIYQGREMAAIQADHAKMMAMFEEEKNRLLAMGIDISNEAAFMEKYNLAERYAMLVELGASDEEIKQKLFHQVQSAKEEESANEKFQRAMGILKDKLVRFVGDGEGLDIIITRVTDFLNSAGVRYLMGVSDEEYIDGILEDDINENQTKIMAHEIKKAINNAGEDKRIFYDPLTGVVVYQDKAHVSAAEIEEQLLELVMAENNFVDQIGEFKTGIHFGGSGGFVPFVSDDPGYLNAYQMSAESRLKALLNFLGGVDEILASPLSDQFYRDIDQENFDLDLDFETGRNSTKSGHFKRAANIAFESLPVHLQKMAETGELQIILQDIIKGNLPGEGGEEYQLDLLNKGFIEVTDVMLSNGELTANMLQSQLDEETLNSAFALLEDRLMYILTAEATGQADQLVEVHQEILDLFLLDYGKSAEDNVHMKIIARGGSERFNINIQNRQRLDVQNISRTSGYIDLGAGSAVDDDAGFFGTFRAMEQARQRGGSYSDVYEGAYTPNFSEIGRGFERFGEEISKSFSFFDDFIQSPGEIPQAFQKGELNVGGNTPSNDPIIQLLEKLVVSLEQQPDKVDLDANVIGIGLATTATRIGTTVR